MSLGSIGREATPGASMAVSCDTLGAIARLRPMERFVQQAKPG